MAVAKTPTPKDDCLNFESFLEALCRLASIKALPTDSEVAEKGCNDAGEYALLMAKDEATREEYENMLRARKIGWGGKPAQSLDRCISHTLSMIIRPIEAVCLQGKPRSGDFDGLTSSMVATWLKRAIKMEDKA